MCRIAEHKSNLIFLSLEWLSCKHKNIYRSSICFQLAAILHQHTIKEASFGQSPICLTAHFGFKVNPLNKPMKKIEYLFMFA